MKPGAGLFAILVLCNDETRELVLAEIAAKHGAERAQALREQADAQRRRNLRGLH